MRERRTSRMIFALAFACAPLLASAALAQPRGKPAPKPKPPAARDAAAPAAEEDAGAGPVEAPFPEAPVDVSDGGRVSPLTPEPEELPGRADAGAPVDYDRVLADIAALRARVAAVASNLYRSRIAVALKTEGKHARIDKLTVMLDDGVVFTQNERFAAADMTQVYEQAVAPGRHAVTVDVERKDARDEAFRTSQRSRFTVDVPRDHHVDVEVRLIDDSSMGADFSADRKGAYDLRFRVKAAARPVKK